MNKHSRSMMWSMAWVLLIGLFGSLAQAAAPDWSVVTYPNYTGVMARVMIDGAPIRAEGSLLAAFYGNEVRGVASLCGANAGDNIDGEYYFNLLFGSDDASETNFTFKLWNAADDQIYDLDKTLDFNTNYPTKPEIYGGFSDGAFVPCVMNVVPPLSTYAITVTNGTVKVNGIVVEEAAEGEIVTITANAPASGKMFDKWTSNDVTFDSATSSPTTFTMPAKAVAITATYKTIPPNLSTIIVKATDKTATEPKSSTASASDTGKIAFSRTGNTSEKVTVYYTISGTATNGTDYTKIAEKITFAAGQTSVSRTVTPLYDTVCEGNETVIVTLNANENYAIGATSSATVTIKDSTPAPTTLPTVTITALDATATEPSSSSATASDTAKFRITRTDSTTSALTVNFTVGGTATSGTDYTAIGTSATIPANSASVDITVTPKYDTLTENDETVIVTLATNAAYTLGSPSSATVTIKNTPVKYSITVVKGTTNKAEAASGEIVTITANTPESGYVFNKWTSNDVTIANATATVTTFTMPAKAVTVTATYTPDGGDDNHYHPADCIEQDFIISGLEYLQYASPVKAAALGNYEYTWDGVDVLSFDRKATRGSAASQTRGNNDIAITRQVSSVMFMAGSTVEVTLTISGADKMTNLFIGESIPEGWTVVGDAAESVANGVLRVTWDSPDIPESFTYTIQAPEDNLAASYVIASNREDTGCFADDAIVMINVDDIELLNNYHPADCITKDGKISGLEYLKYAGPIKAAAIGNYGYTWDGQDVLSLRRKDGTRSGSATDDVAIARTVDTMTYEAGSQVVVTLSVSGADSMVSLFVGEKIPEGWTVVGDYAANVKNGVLRMTWDAPNIPETVTYILQAPAENLSSVCQIATNAVDTGCFVDRVVFLKAEDTVLTWNTDQKPAEWPEDMKLYTPADGKNFRENDKLAVTFSWPAILNADSYRLVVATYDGATVFDEIVKKTVCTVNGLACGSFIWNVTAIGNDCIAGHSDNFFFAIVPDVPAPIIIGASADGTAIRLTFDTADAGYSDGVFDYQMVFFSMKTYSLISLTENLQIANGQAVIDLGVDASNGYLYICPVTTPESSFTELYIK